jgi:DNA-binding helix-hairpin-helix protein with protein kinase domain
VATKDRKSAFRSSIKAEERAVEDRFDKAETVLAKGSKRGSKKGAEEAKPLLAVGRVVRDSFSMPEAEYRTVADVQKRMIKKERVVSKSEVMRAAFAVLNRLNDKELLEIFDSLPKVRPGRPTD